MSIRIKNAWIVKQDANRQVDKQDIYINGNEIEEISKRINTEADYEIEVKNMIVIPGLINTHTHIAMHPFRGLVDDIPLNRFLDITSKYDRKRSEKDIFESALAGATESVRFGTTTVVDLYYSEDIIEKALEKVGLRAILAWVVLDKKFTTQTGLPIRNAINFVNKRHNGIVERSLGFQGIYVCDDETLLKGMEFARKENLIVPMHIAETELEVKNCLKSKKESVVEHLNKIGFLTKNLLAVHSIFLNKKEIDLFAKKGISISHNPTSNMKLGNGIANIPDMLKRGINISLGTDSVSSNNNLDMFKEMKLAALIQKGYTKNASAISAQDALDFATINGAKAIGKEKEIGSIEEGKKADLVIIDPKPNGLPLRQGNIISAAVYAIEGLNVMDVIINGNLILKDRKIQNSTAKGKDSV
ncbi:MAG: amidohydrolase family protein [Candidatus Micrarchaeia archaeon]